MNLPAMRRNRFWMLAGIVALICCLSVAPALAESGGGHGETVSKGWVPTDTYRVVNFALLFIALFLLLKKPVSNALNGRVQGIQDQLADLESQKAEAEKKLAEYNDKLAKLDDEAQQIVEEYIKQGNEAKERIIDAAKKSADKLEEQAKRNIEHEFQKAKQELQAVILEKALEKAEEIINSKITDDDQNRLVDEYLDKVVA